jgi:hypothetical protein
MGLFDGNGGGFFGSGAKETNTENRTENFNLNANFSGNNNNLSSINANNATNSTFTFLDGGAIDRAFDFAEDTNRNANSVLDSVMKMAAAALGDASDVAQPVNVNKIIMFSAVAASVIFVAKFGFSK